MSHFTDELNTADITSAGGTPLMAYYADEVSGWIVIPVADWDEAKSEYTTKKYGSDAYSFWCAGHSAECEIPEALADLIGVQAAFDLVRPDLATDAGDEAACMLIVELLSDEANGGSRWPGVVSGYLEFLGQEEFMQDELEALSAGDTDGVELACYLHEGHKGSEIDYDTIAFAAERWYTIHIVQLIEALQDELANT